MPTYGDRPVPRRDPNQPQQQQGTGQELTEYREPEYEDDYVVPESAFRGMQPSDQASQVRRALFDFNIPETEAEMKEWFRSARLALEMVRRIPNIDSATLFQLNRTWKDLVARAHSQGRKSVIQADMEEFLFHLSAAAAMGETPIAGMTAISALTTTTVNQKQQSVQEVRVPQQPAGKSHWWPFGRG